MKVWVIAVWMRSNLDGLDFKVERVSLKENETEAILEVMSEIRATYSGYTIYKVKGYRK